MSAEDWGFDPYADTVSDTFDEYRAPQDACRLCRHPVRIHNRIIGCQTCTCMATQGEASPRTDAELAIEPIRSNQYRPPYTLRTAPRKDADMKTQAQLERELRTIEQNEVHLAARRAELQRLLDERAALPSEPGEGSVIKFRVQFDVDGIVYEFIAFRTRRNSAAQWYTTGTKAVHKGPHSWDDLLNLMHEDQGIRSGATKVEFFLFDESGKWVR